MSLIIDIAPETEIKLESVARRKGMTADEYAANLIEQMLETLGSDESFLPYTPKIVGKSEMRDFSGEDEWIDKNRDKYAGQYIALHGNRLIAHGGSFKEVAVAARQAGIKDAFITLVEDPNSPPYVCL